MGAGRVLITGGTGFVGRRLVAALVGAGRPVTVATRTGQGPDGPGIRSAAVGEIGPDTVWDDALADAEAVVHLAAHVHIAPERAAAKADLFDWVNHLGTARLCDAAAGAGVSRFVFLSSITVLGPNQVPGHPFTDRSPPRPDTPYARSKLAAETCLTACAARSGMALTVLRPPLICGGGVGGNLGALLRLARLPIPLPFGAVRNRRTLLSRDNLVSAIGAILDHPAPHAVAGTFVLGDREALSTAAIVTTLREGLRRPPLLLPAPPALIGMGLGLAGRAGMARRLLGDLEVESSRFREAAGWTDVTDTRASLRETAQSQP